MNWIYELLNSMGDGGAALGETSRSPPTPGEFDPAANKPKDWFFIWLYLAILLILLLPVIGFALLRFAYP